MAICRDCPRVSLHVALPVCLFASLSISIYVYACQSIIPFASMNSWNVCPTVWLSGCLSVKLCPSVGSFVYVCLSVCLSECAWLLASLFVNVFISVCICFSFYLNVCTSNSMSTVCILVYQSVRLTVCLSVCLHVYARLLSQLAASNRSAHWIVSASVRTVLSSLK